MPNNTADFRGYLTIQSARALESSARVCVEGFITTGEAALGSQHPFFATGLPAAILLEQARARAIPVGETGTPTLNRAVGVHARGKIVSFSGCTKLEVRHISFFDTAKPLSEDEQGFGFNTVTLSGLLSVPKNEILWDPLRAHPTLEGVITTDRPSAGGSHPALFHRESALRVHEIVRIQRGPFPVTVTGRLLSRGEFGCVCVTFISLQPDSVLSRDLSEKSGLD